MPNTKHIFNILTSNSRIVYNNSYNHIKSFLRRQLFGAIIRATYGGDALNTLNREYPDREGFSCLGHIGDSVVIFGCKGTKTF